MSIAPEPQRTPLDPTGTCPVYEELVRLLGHPRGSGTYYEFERLTGNKDPRGWRCSKDIA